MRRSKAVINVTLYFVSLVLIIFVSLEVMVRIWGYSEMYLYDPIYMTFEKSAEIPYIMKPNLNNVKAHGKIRINTDELGLRSAVPGEKYQKKERNEYRIAFLGDSVTFGVGVAFADTYPHIIEEILNSIQHGCKIKVFNFAVSSYSVKEMAATLKYRVPAVSPDLVVMAIVYSDFDLTRTPGLDKLGYNTHRQASEFINRYPNIKRLLRNIHLSYIIRDVRTRASERQRPVEPTPGAMPAWIAQSYRYLLDFRELADTSGYRYFILTLPSISGDDSKFREIIQHLTEDHVKYCDVSTIGKNFTIQEFQASTYDWHPSALVHNKIGEMVSKYIVSNYLPRACGER